MCRYKYLLFDADDTLFDFQKAEHQAFQETCREIGICWSEEAYTNYSRINDSLWKKLEKGEISAESLKIKRFQLFLEWYGYNGSVPDTAMHMRDCYGEALGRQIFFMPDAVNVCEKLRKVYSEMYIITNGIPSVQHARFNASPLKLIFKDIFISGEMGTAKPDPKYFQAVMEKIGDCNVNHYLVIGDSLTSDMKGACSVGMDCCFVNLRGKDIDNSEMNITYTVNKLTELYSILLKE